MAYVRISKLISFRALRRTSPVALCAALIASVLVNAAISFGQAPAQDLQRNKLQEGIRGTVVNAITHAPIGKALVYSPDDRFATLTDSDGHFAFTTSKSDSENGTTVAAGGLLPLAATNIGLPPLTNLRARRPGFLEDNESTQLSQDGDITISLLPEALIKGRITLSTNEPSLGVTVQIFSLHVQDGLPRWIPGASTQVNLAGEFRFAELRPGSYKLATNEHMDNDLIVNVPGNQLFGFPPVYYPNAEDFSSASTIQLAAGETFQADLFLTRQPYYNVHIPVANPETLVGINVWVRGQRGPGYSLGYNSRSGSIEGRLPNGDYVVEASTFVPVRARGSVNFKLNGAAADPPVITLHPESTITFDVREEFTETHRAGSTSYYDGRGGVTVRNGPRSYLQANLESADDFEQNFGGTLRPPKGPTDDSLVIENVAPGRYWLRLSTGRGYVASATFGSVDLLHEPLVVAPGTTTPVEIKMRDDFAQIEGTLANMSTQPVMDDIPSLQAWVYCLPLPDGAGTFQVLGVLPDGKFSSQNLPPGSYRILAFKKQHQDLPYRDAEAMRAYETKGQIVHLTPGQKASIQIQLASTDE